MPSPPQVGECHDTPREVNSFGVALVDAEPAVDCSESHTLETTKVIDVAPGFTAYDAQGFMPECDKAVWRYVDAKPFVSTSGGVDTRSVRGATSGGPVMGPRDASIIRDAYGNAGQRTGSLRNAVGAHPERFVICVQTPQ